MAQGLKEVTGRARRIGSQSEKATDGRRGKGREGERVPDVRDGREETTLCTGQG